MKRFLPSEDAPAKCSKVERCTNFQLHLIMLHRLWERAKGIWESDDGVKISHLYDAMAWWVYLALLIVVPWGVYLDL